MTVSPRIECCGPLLRWAAWLGTVCLGAWLVAAGYEAGQTTIALLTLIAVVGLSGVTQSCLAAWVVVVEGRRARQVVRHLEDRDIAAVLEELKGHPGLFLAVVRGLYRQFEIDHRAVDPTCLFDAMHERLSARTQRGSDTAEHMINLGLIGTVVGLVVLLGRMAEAVQLASGKGGPMLMTELFKEGGALAGLGTAFYTTLAGAAIGGVLLRGLAGSVQRSIDRLVSHCEELVSVYITPHLSDGGSRREEDPE